MSGHPASGATGAAGSGGMGTAGGGPAGSQQQSMTSQNLNQIVLEYLAKKGYAQTERVLRLESAHIEGPALNASNPLIEGATIYTQAMQQLVDWHERNLEIYKTETQRFLWPVFVYSYLCLVKDHSASDTTTFFKTFSPRFEAVHHNELGILKTVTLRVHLQENETTKLYLNNRYRIPVNQHIYYSVTAFLESIAKQGGNKLISLLGTYCEVHAVDSGPRDRFTFDSIINKANTREASLVDQQEGIPGAFTGVSNKDITDNTAVLKLGMLPIEAELAEDVRAELQEEDAKRPTNGSKPSLVEDFDLTIKREDSADAPTRNDIPLPPSRARDVVMEVQRIKEHRDRLRIDGRTGGIGPAVSVCMFTWHNTMDSVTCIEFSDDNNLAAVGTSDSYIRVWHLHGEALHSIVEPKPGEPKPSNSRRLIGHSGPVFAVSFSPSIAAADDADGSTPSTAPRLLLSCSADGTVRLWSLEAWVPLVIYKGHDGPVWSVRWGPFGHYFASCGRDRTVRVWAQDHISYLRMMVGHDTSVNQVAWHPNSAYVFSASDNEDKTVRMWSMITASCVRIFNGHTDFISALECSPDGKILASADGAGSIILWDIAKGTQIKRCKGHGKGGIWSLSFSVESTVLVSGGADGTVRVWDVAVPSDPAKGGGVGEGEVVAVGGQSDATRLSGSGASTTNATGSTAAAAASTGGVAAGVAGPGGKKKGKETVITADQISAFPTKKTPVFRTKFTRMNLILAGGCYLP